MQSKTDANAAWALGLLDWNRAHLTHDSDLSEAAVGERFADRLVVKANGRVYEADRRAYKEFLDGFRRTIAAIDYQVHDTVANEASAVLVMSARVDRLDGSVDRFEAMLLLKFDGSGRVELWQEVYVKAEGPAG
ncbi:hypothetical protein [Lysobacter enzymogenes]|uniref:hypothetical protein n=1 Tax=Lysobacter enzymogenes TaxID=69 RepID=UPI001AF31CCC|nr:hypothetical protein [Lysobacter enzymogenes]QQQ00283.1 hypothetical protein JHW41_19625 [Lysobacter enzymogenes]